MNDRNLYSRDQQRAMRHEERRSQRRTFEWLIVATISMLVTLFFLLSGNPAAAFLSILVSFPAMAVVLILWGQRRI